MSAPWPFSENGSWDGRTWRWRADGITGEQARLLNRLAPRWTWAVIENHKTGDYTFSLTRWVGAEPPQEVKPKPRRNRWTAAK